MKAAAWIVHADRTPFRPLQISCFPLQWPQMPLLCPKLLLLREDLTAASVPLPLGSRSSLTLPLFFPSSLHPPKFCVDLYIPFWCSGILPALSWCSVRSSASKDVSRCIHGGRSIPHPPTPLPSCHLSISHIYFEPPIMHQGSCSGQEQIDAYSLGTKGVKQLHKL